MVKVLKGKFLKSFVKRAPLESSDRQLSLVRDSALCGSMFPALGLYMSTDFEIKSGEPGFMLV